MEVLSRARKDFQKPVQEWKLSYFIWSISPITALVDDVKMLEIEAESSNVVLQ